MNNHVSSQQQHTPTHGTSREQQISTSTSPYCLSSHSSRKLSLIKQIFRQQLHLPARARTINGEFRRTLSRARLRRLPMMSSSPDMCRSIGAIQPKSTIGTSLDRVHSSLARDGFFLVWIGFAGSKCWPVIRGSGQNKCILGGRFEPPHRAHKTDSRLPQTIQLGRRAKKNRIGDSTLRGVKPS